MKLYMKQRVFTWTDRFDIADEQGNTRYYVEGELFSWGKKLHVYNRSGVEVAFIRQKIMAWLPQYFIEINGRTVASVVKEFTFFRPSYRVEGLPWVMEGDYWSHNYVMHHKGREVMRLSKAWFTWGDSYELEIMNPEDELLSLCVTLAVDCAIEQSRD